MSLDQTKTPLYDMLVDYKNRALDSYHVPGHKNGKIFSSRGMDEFQSFLQMDATEITGMDDLHDAHGPIQEAQALAADYFNSESSYFLINGSTAGNLAMLLTICQAGDKIIVQRNCHKSILHGLELAGAQPVFLAPSYEEQSARYSKIEVETVEEALVRFPEAKGLVLTYPDYFGRTYEIEEIIKTTHHHEVPVLVDEAHGIHFHLGRPFPSSALEAGADLVVQSAHKMAPAMTMASMLHANGDRIDMERLRYFLQVFQSSSPSYPLMASLDLARHFLANATEEMVGRAIQHATKIRDIFAEGEGWTVLPGSGCDDPLKVTLQADRGWTGLQLATLLEDAGVFPELALPDQLLLITGLGDYIDVRRLKNSISNVNEQLKTTRKHATIKAVNLYTEKIQELAFSYEKMKKMQSVFTPWQEAAGKVAAQPIVPYPPGVPLLVKGETITKKHVEQIVQLIDQGTRFHNEDIKEGMVTFK